MHTLKIALTIFFALLLQMVLPKYLPFFKYIDLALLVTVFLSLQREPFQGMWTGFIAGLGGDIIAGGILGVGGFTKTLIGYLIAVASIKFPLENPLARLAVVAVASAANTVLYVGLHLMLEQDLPHTSNWAEFSKTVGWKALGDTVTAIFLFIVLNRVFYEQEQTRRMAIKKRFYE
ncbi:MAG TPA: rod shape-determining protein MreD [Blastocatellia bacterium]|nr:rod shape-determining protein MreD [Blastocatellia bacterium]